MCSGKVSRGLCGRERFRITAGLRWMRFGIGNDLGAGLRRSMRRVAPGACHGAECRSIIPVRFASLRATKSWLPPQGASTCVPAIPDAAMQAFTPGWRRKAIPGQEGSPIMKRLLAVAVLAFGLGVAGHGPAEAAAISPPGATSQALPGAVGSSTIQVRRGWWAVPAVVGGVLLFDHFDRHHYRRPHRSCYRRCRRHHGPRYCRRYC